MLVQRESMRVQRTPQPQAATAQTWLVMQHMSVATAVAYTLPAWEAARRARGVHRLRQAA